MALTPMNKKTATLSRSPRTGSPETFSNGKKSVNVQAWEVYNSRNRIQVQRLGRIYGDETSVVVQTHDKIAGELLTDDAVTIDGYSYSVQSVAQVKSVISINAYDYEIALK